MSQALLAEESNLVQRAMAHGDIDDAHRAAWEAVDAEIFFVPGKGKFGRLSMFGAKERLESLEQNFAVLRSQMANDSKSAAKMEKKLGILLMGYVQRAQKQRDAFGKLYEAYDQVAIEATTFDRLRSNELRAIPSRIEVCCLECC
jgi:pre-mRNA-splicing factor CDC5/CEF1